MKHQHEKNTEYGHRTAAILGWDDYWHACGSDMNYIYYDEVANKNTCSTS